MVVVKSAKREMSLGFKVRRLRLSQLLTTEELASLAHVTQEDVNLLESNLPLRLDAKRKLLKELWARRASRQ